MSRRALLLLTLMMIALMAVASPAWADTFTVNSTGDEGDAAPSGVCNTEPFPVGTRPNCTLRAAIQEANATTAADTITFNIPGTGVKTISPASSLPPITQPVTINGYTQRPCSTNPAPCSKENSSAVGTNAVLLIELNGENVSPCDCGGLQLNTSDSVVKGLVINRFSSGVYLLPTATGTATGNRIEGNFIGTDPSGTLDRGNLSDGVPMQGNSNTVGGTSLAARNLISGNGQDGIHARGSGNWVLNNLIGTDHTGTQPLRNDAHGLVIDEVFNIPSGDTAANTNVIAFNGEDGVSVQDGATGISILGNSIFSNTGLGIDLKNDGRTANDDKDPDVGPNLLQNYPVVTTAKPITKRVKGKRRKFTVIAGTLNSTPGESFTIQLFRNPSGEDEGKTLLTQFTRMTDANGDASFSLRVPRSKAPIGSNITATATDSSGNTSEFSPPKIVGI